MTFWTLRALLVVFCVLVLVRRQQAALQTLSDMDDAVGNLMEEYLSPDPKTAIIPLQDPTDVMNVTVSMEILSIANMDADTGYFTLSGRLMTSWVEERHDPVAGDVTIHLWADSVWTPSLRIVNAANPETSKLLSKHDRIRFNLETNTITWNPTVLVTIGCSSNAHFPFEEYRCSLKLVDQTYDASQLQLLTNATQLSTRNYASNSEWTLKSTTVNPVLGVDTPTIEYTIVLERASVLYSILTLAPTLSISTIHLFVFLLPPQGNMRADMSSTCSLMSVIFLLATCVVISNVTSSISTLTYYVTAELLVSVVMTIIVLVQGTHTTHCFTGCREAFSRPQSKRVSDSQTGLHGTSSSSRDRAPIGPHGGTRVSEVMTDWDDVDEQPQPVSGNSDKGVGDSSTPSGQQHKPGTSTDVFLFAAFLALQVIITLAFLIPLSTNSE